MRCSWVLRCTGLSSVGGGGLECEDSEEEPRFPSMSSSLSLYARICCESCGLCCCLALASLTPLLLVCLAGVFFCGAFTCRSLFVAGGCSLRMRFGHFLPDRELCRELVLMAKKLHHGRVCEEAFVLFDLRVGRSERLQLLTKELRPHVQR